MAKAQVLVTEDESIVAMDIQGMLEDLGYAVPAVASSGEEAIRMAEETRPDLVVMDIMLHGGLDGVEAAQQIHARLNIPIIFLTANADEKMLERAKVAEPYGYIIKPFKNREIQAAIEMALHKRELEEELKKYRDHLEELVDARTNELKKAVEQLEQEIARRELAEEERRQTEGRFHNIFCHSNDAIFIIDPAQDSILDVNPKACSMLGYSREELLSRNASALHPGQQSQMSAFAQSVSERGSGSDNELTYATSGGQVLQAEISASIMDVDGKSCIIALVRDMTERRRLEERLIQSQKMEAIGQLAGGVAHDFNNLLTAIMGYAQLSVSYLPPEGQASRYLQEIQKAAKLASHLTNQLLAFSRRQMIKPRVVNLNDLISDINDMLRRLIGEDIEFVALPAPDLGLVRADVGQLEQVLVNLAVNARDSMPTGGKLNIKTANVAVGPDSAIRDSELAPGKYVMMSVSDTGCGMTEEVQAHLFEPFFTTKGPGKGTGLGLATCYGIIMQSGGHIAVCSQVGRGSTFEIYLPQVEEATGVLSMGGRLDSLPQGDEVVLLVEDEPLVRNMVAEVLRDQGYSVLQAANGDDALGLVEQNASKQIHLLLTDIVMPRMGGRELADRLRATHPETRVLFTSGYTEDAIIQQGLLNPFMQKPFSPATVARRVREVLDK